MRNCRLTSISLLLFLSYLFSGCASQKQALQETDLANLYQNAVQDAEHAEPDEIYRNLVAIVPSNPNLVWQANEDQRYVLVATWTAYDGYDDKLGQAVDLTREMWVTTVPEAKNFCKKHANTSVLRLEQLFGLPPNAGKTKFVELWVKPSDLLRPSPDPEISDHEAEIDFPISAKFVTVSADYINWFNAQKMKSYGAQGYPWTRLGYTYDWGNAKNHVGLSEFVIVQGAAVKINAIAPTFEYCR